MSEENIIEKRKEEVFNFFKKGQAWVIILLVIALILGIYIRSLPMTDHGGNPGLWDIATNTWTLGPDLDPWLFERYAKDIVDKGDVPHNDLMRNVPLGFDTTIETQLLPFMIAGIYYFLNLFSTVNMEFAAVIFPVIMFALTILSFFFFVREVFLEKSKENLTKANLIAIISTFLMIVIPIFLSRTVAGIPEKESAAFFFMFLSMYLFLKSWKNENLKKSIIFSILSGIATGMMGLIWGGVIYLFIPIGLISLIVFILNKIKKREFILYSLWILSSFSILLIFSNKYPLLNLLTSLDSGLVSLVFFISLIHLILWNTQLSKNNYLQKLKIPKTIFSLIFSSIILIILLSLLFGPSFIIDKFKAIHQTIFQPIVGRWSTTVAENSKPSFHEWSDNFGPLIKNIPILFTLFLMGSVVLFKKILNKLKRKDSWILTILYVLFLFGMIFSNYSSSSILNGDSFISKSFFYIPLFLLIGYLIFYYLKYEKEAEKIEDNVNYGYLLLLLTFLSCLFTARGAVRLVMVLAPLAAILAGYLIIESIYYFRKIKDETFKVIFGIILIIILIASLFTFYTFYNDIKAQSYSFVPNFYNQQWQKAMQWVRDETPADAVFSHWWDYGYWLQSIGNRATVSDGGNAIAYWNYLMGRLVLTGDNQKDSLEFLYNHNASYLLIDSSDIGKYGAFSSIGSNKTYDRYSWIGTFLLDEKQTQETNNQTIFLYTGGIALDESLIINENGKEILLPGQKTGVGAIILPMNKINNSISSYSQPFIIAIYQGKQYKINLRYLSIGEKFVDFKSGIEACAYIFPSIIQQSSGIGINPQGASMFLSPRLMRGFLAQKYILDDPFNKFPNFKLSHTEPNLIIDNFNSQGANLPDFVYFQGVQGPIKIWEIKYTGNEKIKEEYLDVDYTKYIDWRL